MIGATLLAKSAVRHRGVEGSGGVPIAVQPGAPASWSTREHVRVMEQSVEERGDGRGVAEQFPPVLDGSDLK
jgi:hypothetical protein